MYFRFQKVPINTKVSKSLSSVYVNPRLLENVLQSLYFVACHFSCFRSSQSKFQTMRRRTANTRLGWIHSMHWDLVLIATRTSFPGSRTFYTWLSIHNFSRRCFCISFWNQFPHDNPRRLWKRLQLPWSRSFMPCFCRWCLRLGSSIPRCHDLSTRLKPRHSTWVKMLRNKICFIELKFNFSTVLAGEPGRPAACAIVDARIIAA